MTMQELFEKISEVQETRVTEITLSYLEIYNETIRDLLVEGGSTTTLMLREDANQAVSVAGLSSHRPQNVSDSVSPTLGYSNKLPGPRSHGYYSSWQRIPHYVTHRSKRDVLTITRRTPDQRIVQRPQRRGQ